MIVVMILLAIFYYGSKVTCIMPKLILISLVMHSGPGHFLSFYLVKELVNSTYEIGEFITGRISSVLPMIPRETVSSTFQRLLPCYAMLCYVMLCHDIPCYAMPRHAMPRHAMPRHAMPCHATPCHAMPRHAMPCYAMPCNAMLCHAMLCYAMLCYAMLCHAISCYAMLCYAMICPDMP